MLSCALARLSLPEAFLEVVRKTNLHMAIYILAAIVFKKMSYVGEGVDGAFEHGMQNSEVKCGNPLIVPAVPKGSRVQILLGGGGVDELFKFWKAI